MDPSNNVNCLALYVSLWDCNSMVIIYVFEMKQNKKLEDTSRLTQWLVSQKPTEINRTLIPSENWAQKPLYHFENFAYA